MMDGQQLIKFVDVKIAIKELCHIVGNNPPVRVRGGMIIYKITVSDDESQMTITFFNQLKEKIAGMRVDADVVKGIDLQDNDHFAPVINWWDFCSYVKM